MRVKTTDYLVTSKNGRPLESFPTVAKAKEFQSLRARRNVKTRLFITRTTRIEL